MSKKDNMVIVPKYRFPEFRDKWEIKPFKKYIKLYRGSSPRPIQDFITKNEGINWIKISDASNSNNFYITNVAEQITEEGAKKSRLVEEGELILANSMSFGATYEVGVSGCIYDGWFVLREYEDSFIKKFLLQQLNTYEQQKQYSRLSAGGVVKNISSDIVYETILKRPSKKEQQKIADCLSSIDDLISAEEKKLSLLNDYKKGWMQKLFPAEGKTVPEWRFPEFQDSEEWAQKKLDEIGKFIRGFSYSSQDTTDDETKLLVIRSNNIVPMGKTDYINNLRYVNKKCSKEQNLIFGDITICMANGSSNLIGKSSFYDGGYAGDITVGAFCGIFRSPLPIVRYLFQTNQYNRELQRVSQGGDGAIANLKEIDIKNIEFLLPTLPEEQQKIANFLSGIDDLIGRQTDKIEALKQHKQALMQGLFPATEEVW